MGTEMNYKEILDSCPASGSGVHSWMMSVANIAAREEIPQSQVEEDIREHMTRKESPSSEVADTVEKAFAEKGRKYDPAPKKTPEEKAISDERIATIRAKSFIRMAGDPIGASELINISPVDVKTPKGFESQMAAKLLLYLYDRHELLWCGITYGKDEGLKTVEEWAESFLCLDPVPPFFIPNPLTGEIGKTKSGNPSVRCDETIEDWRYALFEVDLPQVTLGHQAAFWKKMIEQDQMPVESVTYSGGKSLHALIRVNCKTEVQWDKEVRNGAFVEWIKIGADKMCRNPSRLSRLPGCRRPDKNGKMQTLLYLRGGK